MSWDAEMTGQHEDGHGSETCMRAVQISGHADGFLDDSCLWECAIPEDCALPAVSQDLATVFDHDAPRAPEVQCSSCVYLLNSTLLSCGRYVCACITRHFICSIKPTHLQLSSQLWRTWIHVAVLQGVPPLLQRV